MGGEDAFRMALGREDLVPGREDLVPGGEDLVPDGEDLVRGASHFAPACDGRVALSLSLSVFLLSLAGLDRADGADVAPFVWEAAVVNGAKRKLHLPSADPFQLG